MTDHFFSELGNTNPYVSIGFQGEAGSGKSYTAAAVGAGIHKQIRSSKSVAIFSTEANANFMAPIFKQDNIPAKVVDSRTLPDLITAINKCAQGASDILIIDSITEVWEHFLDSFSNGGRNELDMIRINSIWRERLTQLMQSAPVHILSTIRLGYQYEETITNGKRNYSITGTKRRIGNDFAFGPDVLVNMKLNTFNVGGAQGTTTRIATVFKGRGPDLVDGMVIRDPNYSHFKKYVDFVLSNPKSRTETDSQSNESLIAEENAIAGVDKEALVAKERNRELLKSIKIDNAAENRVTLFSLTRQVYGETSETAINAMTTLQHESAHDRLAPLISTIQLVRQWEALVFPNAELPICARINHLKTSNLGEVSISVLNKYYEYLTEKHNKKS